MSLILNIDTALEHASVSISSNGIIIDCVENAAQKSHAAFLQPAIEQLVTRTDISLKQMDAIAITAGPGSYTGLRVGMASAKGIAYALAKPLILLSTLEVMLQSALDPDTTFAANISDTTLFCPMIDARRMEVFTALYDRSGHPIMTPQALILEVDTFDTYLKDQSIYFFGNGSEKFKKILTHPKAFFVDTTYTAAHIAKMSKQLFDKQLFTDLAYSEPQYLKGFFDTSKK